MPDVAPLLRHFLDLCLLRRGPQDLPYSPPLAWGLVAALMALQWIVARHGGFGIADATLRIALGVFLLVGVTRALLAWRGVGNRADQTITAFAGAGLLFSLVVLPFALALDPGATRDQVGGAQLAMALVVLTLFVWKLRVDAHIWRHALDLRAGAIALAVAMMLLELLLLALINPTEPR